MEHDLDVHLKCIKVTFSNKQIGEIKKKLHIDPIFAYWDSEIASEVSKRFKRIKFDRSALCPGLLKPNFEYLNNKFTEKPMC